MNKPAAKEPSMDEILSSIRQIIADDDASAADSPAEASPEPEADEAEALSFDLPDDLDIADITEDDEPEALALSEEQIVEDDVSVEIDDSSFPDLPDLESAISDDSDVTEEETFDIPDIVEPEEVDFSATEVEEETASAAPMPDAELSSDLAERLLEPATDAAVKSAFSRIGSASLASANHLTVEAMIREMLRPMLKGWLDENLPGMVEKIVAKEIERLSRGE